MLVSQEIIDYITQNEIHPSNVYNNNDYKVSDVLNFCSDESPRKHFLRYPDGKEEYIEIEK